MSYKLLKPTPIDIETHPYLIGVLYDKNQNLVSGKYEFNDDSGSEQFKMVLDESESLYLKREIIDNIYFRASSSEFHILISARTKQLLEARCPGSFRFIKVNIIGTKAEINNYFLATILERVDCVNIQESELELKENGFFTRPRKLVFNEEQIPDSAKVFLLGNTYARFMVFHPDVVNEIEELGYSGFYFYDLQNIPKYL